MNSCRLRIRVLQLCHGIVPKPPENDEGATHAVHNRQAATSYLSSLLLSQYLPFIHETENSKEK
jgi:hypothetical protein